MENNLRGKTKDVGVNELVDPNSLLKGSSKFHGNSREIELKIAKKSVSCATRRAQLVCIGSCPRLPVPGDSGSEGGATAFRWVPCAGG